MSQREILTKPRVSKSGSTKFTWWDETPLLIRQALETKGSKNVEVEGFDEYTFSTKTNSSGGQTVFWNPKDEQQQITGQPVETISNRFTRKATAGGGGAKSWNPSPEQLERERKKSEQIQKLHDETVAATNKNTESNFRVADELANIRRQLEDLSFVLSDLCKGLKKE